jgi:hypothetical protein
MMGRGGGGWGARVRGCVGKGCDSVEACGKLTEDGRYQPNNQA